MLLHVTRGCITITYMNAWIGLQHVSTDIFNCTFSDATSNTFVFLVFTYGSLLLL
jgi:hypothetical protein